jgi:hypothetical protein
VLPLMSANRTSRSREAASFICARLDPWRDC